MPGTSGGGATSNPNSPGVGMEKKKADPLPQFETPVTFKTFLAIKADDEKGTAAIGQKEDALRRQLEKIPGTTLANGTITVQFKGTLNDLKKLDSDVRRIVSTAVMTSPIIVEANWSAKTKEATKETLEGALKSVTGMKDVFAESDAQAAGAAARSGKVTMTLSEYEAVIDGITDTAMGAGFNFKITTHSTLALTAKDGESEALRGAAADFADVRGVFKVALDESSKTYKVLIRNDMVGKIKLTAVAKARGIRIA